MELQQHALSLQATIHDIAEENRKLMRQVEDLSRCADFGNEFKSSNGVYWRETVPYCPICWDVERKPVRLSGPLPAINAPAGKLMWICTLDNGQFPLPRINPAESRTAEV